MLAFTARSTGNKHDAIAAHLRREIAARHLRPGARLPVRAELEDRFAASRMTVQRAMTALARDGFTVARGKLGTFVAAQPPCLARYGLVFSARPSAPGWSGLDATMLRVADACLARGEPQVVAYYGVCSAHHGDHGHLLQEVQQQRLAGLIFVEPPTLVLDSPLLGELPVPRVALMDPAAAGTPLARLHTVRFDHASLMRVALRTLVARGCRQPAVLMLAKTRQRFLPLFHAAAAAEGLTIHPWCCQAAPAEDREWAANITHLLWRLPPADRPDGLFIADDNLVDAAVQGLTDAGVYPGRDVPVVAECNFPAASTGHVLERVGFDNRAILTRCLEILTGRHAHRPPLVHTSVSAIRERELPASDVALS